MLLSGGSRRTGRFAFVVLAGSLDSGERVEVLAQCRFLGEDGAIALTDRRLLIVNARQWDPDVVSIDIQPGLTVQGWQTDRAAALVFSQSDGDDLIVDRIGDTQIAMRLADGYRARVG